MPITIQDYKLKRSKENMPITREKLDKIEPLLEYMIHSNGEDTSYLKGELTPYITALQNLTSVNPDKFTQNDLDTLNGFYNFLQKDINDINVFSRLAHDNGLLLTAFNEPLNALKDIMGYTDNEFNINTLIESYRVNNHTATRVINTKEVTGYEQLMAEKEKGKNFLEPGCRDAKAVEEMLSEMKKAIDAKTIEGLQTYYDAIITIKDAPKKDASEEQKNNVAAALNTMKGLPAFLTAGIDKTNYQRLTDAKLDMDKFDAGLKAVDKVLLKGIDPDEIKRTAPKLKTQKTTALQYINDQKDTLKKYSRTLHNSADYPVKFYARIMAARLLANSKRRNEDSLKAETTNIDIMRKADELLENKSFKQFMKILDNPKVLKEVESWTMSKYSHGGKLDDLFTSFLANQPAGKMENSKLLERYMPSNLMRIEALQKKAEEKLNSHQAPDKEIAEIILLRSSAGIKRDEKNKLKNTKVMTNFDLESAVDKLSKEPAITRNRIDSKQITLVKEGHGGLMMEEMKKNRFVLHSPLIRNVLNVDYNAFSDQFKTPSDRMEYLRDVAKLVVFDLTEELKKKTPNEEKVNKLTNIGKDVLFEELALADISNEMAKNPGNLTLFSEKNIFLNGNKTEKAPTFTRNPKTNTDELIPESLKNRRENKKWDENLMGNYLPLDENKKQTKSVLEELEKLSNAKNYPEIKKYCKNVEDAAIGPKAVIPKGNPGPMLPQ